MFGGAISAMENPRLILEQNIRELNDQVPKMNNTIVKVKSAVLRHRKELKKAQRMEADLTNKIKQALRVNRQDIAREFALRLERTRNEVQQTSSLLAQAEQAYEKALSVKKVFMRERQRKIEEAQAALRAHERAKAQAEVADALEQFEVGGIDQSHDEMISRIEEQTAESEARMEVALDSADMQSLRLEEDAESYHADELLQQFQLEMGMDPGESFNDPLNDPLLNPTDSSRTMGRGRTGSL